MLDSLRSGRSRAPRTTFSRTLTLFNGPSDQDANHTRLKLVRRHGILEVNPLVTFKVLFQCKRYKRGGQVTSGQVRDFLGRWTVGPTRESYSPTATFTTDAKKEASRDGVKSIELVDQDKLVTIFERAGLGLRAVQTFELDRFLFEEFGK